jgi:CubicO group peptidase (beta-lactamase class C family)
MQLTTLQVPGAAFAVMRDGKLVFSRGYGVVNATTMEPGKVLLSISYLFCL